MRGRGMRFRPEKEVSVKSSTNEGNQDDLKNKVYPITRKVLNWPMKLITEFLLRFGLFITW